MTIRLNSKIVGYEVVQPGSKEVAQNDDIQEMHESLKRPEDLEGTTYKIKTPGSEHAMYVTINDVILNPGTNHEVRRRSEERRVGKECRTRGWPDHEKEKWVV